MYGKIETNPRANRRYQADVGSGGTTTEGSKAAGSGEEKNQGKGKGKTHTRADRSNQADVGGAKSTRDLINDAQASSKDTGEALREACNERAKRLAEKLGIRAPRVQR